jgi:hypothetical protein
VKVEINIIDREYKSDISTCGSDIFKKIRSFVKEPQTWLGKKFISTKMAETR